MGISAEMISSLSRRLPSYPVACTEVLTVFDELIPLQYSEQDRRGRIFFW